MPPPPVQAAQQPRHTLTDAQISQLIDQKIAASLNRFASDAGKAVAQRIAMLRTEFESKIAAAITKTADPEPPRSEPLSSDEIVQLRRRGAA